MKGKKIKKIFEQFVKALVKIQMASCVLMRSLAQGEQCKRVAKQSCFSHPWTMKKI